MLLVVMLLRYIKVCVCLCILMLEWFPCCCKFEQLQWDVMVGKEAYTCTHITFAPAIHNSACFGVTTGVRKPGPGGKAEKNHKETSQPRMFFFLLRAICVG